MEAFSRAVVLRQGFLWLMVAALAGCSNGGSNGIAGGDGDGDSNQSVADFHTLNTPALDPGQFELLTLSTMPDTVTGGDVLLAVRGLGEEDAFTVARNGDDVTDRFERQENGDIHGLVDGLMEGPNVLQASANGQSATLQVMNHPVTGPVISGPHQEPFACRTEEAGLGEPVDENCSIETQFQWFYRSTADQQYHELEDPFAPYPGDTMTTVTSEGEVVPFVVRVESATINRGIARIAVLDDPQARGPEAPFEPNWNRRVYYVFGESCGVGYQQGVNSVDFVLAPPPDPREFSADNLLINFVGASQRLGVGDVVTHSTLSAFGVHCNPFISIETTMMVKEHVIESYGGPVHQFIGTNGSGAALQQYNAANNAPGLLTGAMPTATFADIASTAMTVTDCGLLVNYFENSELDWSNPQKQAAVTGHDIRTGINNDPIEPLDPSGESEQINNAICTSWKGAFFNRIIPTEGCSVPNAPEGERGPQFRYHPENNPEGVRCTVQDANVNWLGIDPQTGFANRPLDNVGIQYGLRAFNEGDISFEEFVDLNRNIGGLDPDGNFVPERHAMSAQAEARIYEVGQVIGRGALAETPIMDLAPYLDLIPVANIHEAVRPFTIRARLNARTGQEQTQSIWRGLLTQPDAFIEMDQWTEALREMRMAGGSGDPVQDVISARPENVTDFCSFGTTGGRLDLPDGFLLPLGVEAPLLPAATVVSVPLRINAPEEWEADGSGSGPCALFLPVTGTPRLAAGMPMSDDIIKCQLKPLDPNDYAVPLDAGQMAALAEVFPQGVCDYSRPAAGDVDRSLLWPSLGGENLNVDNEGNPAPFELRWRVARSG